MGCLHKYRTKLWDLPPQTVRQELFEPILQLPHVRIERIISPDPAQFPSQWYEQKQHEWVAVIQGQAVLEWASGGQTTLTAGEMVWIPAGCRHRVLRIEEPLPTIWLAIHIQPLEEEQ